MKKLVSILLAVLMLFSVVGMTATVGAEDLDSEINENVDSLIGGVVDGNDALENLIAIFRKIIDFFTPDVASEKAEVQGFALVNGFDSDKPFHATYSFSTDINYSNVKVAINTVYEYRTLSGESWSGWQTAASYGRFNFGYIRSADGSVKYNNYFFRNLNIPANTAVGSWAEDKSDFSAIEAIADGTVYEVRVVLTVNNGFATTNFTSGNYQFIR